MQCFPFQNMSCASRGVLVLQRGILKFWNSRKLVTLYLCPLIAWFSSCLFLLCASQSVSWSSELASAYMAQQRLLVAPNILSRPWLHGWLIHFTSIASLTCGVVLRLQGMKKPERAQPLVAWLGMSATLVIRVITNECSKSSFLAALFKRWWMQQKLMSNCLHDNVHVMCKSTMDASSHRLLRIWRKHPPLFYGSLTLCW